MFTQYNTRGWWEVSQTLGGLHSVLILIEDAV